MGCHDEIAERENLECTWDPNFCEDEVHCDEVGWKLEEPAKGNLQARQMVSPPWDCSKRLAQRHLPADWMQIVGESWEVLSDAKSGPWGLLRIELCQQW